MRIRGKDNRSLEPRSETVQHFTINGREITASFAAEPNPEAYERIRDVLWSVFSLEKLDFYQNTCDNVGQGGASHAPCQLNTTVRNVPTLVNESEGH